jgi:uncharacterized membrane protein
MDHKASLILIHASSFFAPFLVPIIFIFIAKEEEVKSIATQALLFHIVLGLALFVSMLLSMIIIGIPLLVLFLIMGVWYPIKGIIFAAKDRFYQYPVVGKWVS